MQLTFDDIPAAVVGRASVAAQEAAHAGMAQVEGNTSPEWREQALAALKRVCETRARLTTDDVWAELDLCQIPVHNNSALGPIMLAGSKRGWMKFSGTMQASSRPTRHGNQLRIWMSCLYRAAEAK